MIAQCILYGSAAYTIKLPNFSLGSPRKRVRLRMATITPGHFGLQGDSFRWIPQYMRSTQESAQPQTPVWAYKATWNWGGKPNWIS